MGITGLLPFLEKKTAKKVSLEDLSGCTAAVDTYCWLHKGVFTCADKLAMGVKTDGYVQYCMNYVNLLLRFKIKPILVFDGRHLPAKAETELKRRENREANRKRASELMKMGEHQQGINLLKRAIDVSHEMALDVMKKCQQLNIDCIVAPYEADAQLAYLNISGIADFVITEDSDLTLFGCTKILFKMDKYGCGTLVEQDKLYLSMNLRKEEFTIDKFRHMCILSGCDYLASLPGVGLVKALRFAQRNTDDDIYNALARLSTYINKSVPVTTEYRESFVRALITFKHQLVYCPIRRKQVRLNEPPPEVTSEQLHHAGDPVDEELAYQLALGNCNPFGFKKMNDFDPDNRPPVKRKTNSWKEPPTLSQPSIWSKEFKVKTISIPAPVSETTKWPDTHGKVVEIESNIRKKKPSPLKMTNNVQNSKPSPMKTPPSMKRSSEHFDNELSKEDLMRLYGNPKMIKGAEKKDKPTVEQKKEEEHKFTSPTTSPRKFNPFLKKPACSDTSPSLVIRGRRRPKITTIAFQPTIVDETVVTESKFFSKPGCSKEDDEKAVIIPETLDFLQEEFVPRNLEKEIVRRNVIIPETQDEFAASDQPKTEENVINTEDFRKIAVTDDVVPSESKNQPINKDDQEEYERNKLNVEEIKKIDHNTPRNSVDGRTEENDIIPETPDDEELPSSQGSCKENDDLNVHVKPFDPDQSLSRSDSGVDMKEDTTEKNPSPHNSPPKDKSPKYRRQSSGLDITIRKYGLKSPVEQVKRPPSPENLEELFGSSQPINNLTSNFFKWENTKNNNKPTNFLSNQPARSLQKKPLSQSKIKSTKKPSAVKKMPQLDSQQSVLNMFGFRRKEVVKN